MASNIAPEDPPKALRSLPLPFSTRLNYAIKLFAFKALVRAFVNVSKFLLIFKGKDKKATYTKTYRAVPSVTNRVFIPPSWKKGDAPLPLLIDVHGGGFAIGDPVLDDPDNLILSHQHRICVVAIGYRLAPQARWPLPVEDVAALAEAVLDDPDLPVDKKNVAIGGYSAGGNLCLAAPQLRNLSQRIKASVAYYPAVDFSIPTSEKLKLRAPTSEPDMLRETSKWFNWGYVPPNTETQNPLLSPMYADREKLPKKICLIGCEFDLLCVEAERMAERLAKADGGEKKVESDGTVWQTKNVRWEKVLGMPHGFNQLRKGGEQGEVMKRRAAQMHAAVAKWLFDEVFV